ncbi:MAG: hypothetical protein KA116_07280 [Proteobacteria bacterium]|nr:hypothetical protein [Pseudomonadota bacterium]
MMHKLGWLLCVSTLAIALHFTQKETHDQVARDIANSKQLDIENAQHPMEPIDQRHLNALKEIQKAID